MILLILLQVNCYQVKIHFEAWRYECPATLIEVECYMLCVW